MIMIFGWLMKNEDTKAAKYQRDKAQKTIVVIDIKDIENMSNEDIDKYISRVG